MSRYLTTQERVNLAVEAGHYKLVKDYISQHNNGDGVKSELESLKVVTPSGEEHNYTLLPPYGIAAIDSYLNIYNIPLVTTDDHVQGLAKRHPSMSQMAKYAKQAAEDAAVYRGARRMYRPEGLVERVASALEYEAIDTNFQILVACATARALIDCGLKLVEDADTGAKTLTLSNGAVIEMHLDTELAEYLQRTYVLANEGVVASEFVMQPGYVSIATKLIELLEEEVDRQLKLV